MKRFLCCLLILLQIVNWIPVTRSRLLASNENPQAPYFYKQENAVTSTTAKYVPGVNKLGSRPPNCEHKCDGCIPCMAIQVPTITSHLGIQYANYEPESWKCKCGPSFYTP